MCSRWSRVIFLFDYHSSDTLNILPASYMPNKWRTINSLVHKIPLHGRRGKIMAESFSREKLRLLRYTTVRVTVYIHANNGFSCFCGTCLRWSRIILLVDFYPILPRDSKPCSNDPPFRVLCCRSSSALPYELYCTQANSYRFQLLSWNKFKVVPGDSLSLGRFLSSPSSRL